MKQLFIVIVLLFLFSCSKNVGNKKNTVKLPATSIPLAGNAYITVPACNDASGTYTSNGLAQWSSTSTVISTYFYLSQGGDLSVSIDASVPEGKSVVKVTLNGTSKNITLTEPWLKIYNVGNFAIGSSGYVHVDMQGVSKSGGVFASVPDIEVSGTATVSSALSLSNVVYANDSSNYYWSLRGPSVHLGYPDLQNAEWFYNEVTVPIGSDHIGSYFMANGFAEGYFGIQVNSSSERRILFSVWNPSTGNTTAIRSGKNVVVKTFSGEGTGGQAYLDYNWKAGTTYKFLTQALPETDGSTSYSAWMYSPEINQWLFIATWNRPNTTTYLKGLYSFVEDFDPDYGYLEKKAFFGNQWIRDSQGNWTEVTTASFTTDATGKNKQRLDFAGGVSNNEFYLQMDGFFNPTTINSSLERSSNGNPPSIDFSKLP